MSERLLLLSTTKISESGFSLLAKEVSGFFGKIERILFIPYAVKDHGQYVNEMRELIFAELGYDLYSIHEANNPKEAIRSAQAIYVGGGNSFRLLKALYDHGILELIRKQAREGIPYMGSSAGSNMACPTIRTTNDMPIVYPPTLKALNLIPFQINPHYTDPDPHSTHRGETREERIIQFHEENSEAVVGLREGALLHVLDHRVSLQGISGARVFVQGQKAREFNPGDHLDFLLD